MVALYSIALQVKSALVTMLEHLKLALHLLNVSKVERTCVPSLIIVAYAAHLNKH